MWIEDLLWGLWNGLTAWIILIAHVLGFWDRFPFSNEGRSGNWYDLGFVIGAGSPLFGLLNPRRPAAVVSERRAPACVRLTG